MLKKAVLHISAVIKGILFTGFSIQILMGIYWMGCHYLQVQDFAEADSVLYLWIFRLTGENPQIMFLVQLLFAFYAAYRFVDLLCFRSGGSCPGYRKLYVVWGSLAILTFPFAMQCHLALQPFSLMGSLFLLTLSFFYEMIVCPQGFPGGKKGLRRKAGFLTAAVLCAGFMTILSGMADRHEEEPECSLASAMASRMAWPDLWSDFEYWPEDLREIAGDVVWQASLSADNMKILFAALEERAGREAAGEYCRQIAEIGWRYHSSDIIHRICWDMLGYTMTPFVFRQQMEGVLFDSYTGSNYEAMQMHMPVYTKRYVEYSCWWFGCCLVLAVGLAILHIFTVRRLSDKRSVLAGGVCILAAGVLVTALAMRGAGRMDYRYTIAVNELWLLWALRQMCGGAGISGGKAESAGSEPICAAEAGGQSEV